MDIRSYEIESKIEESHWWFVGRRRLLSNLVHPLNLDRSEPILDVGTGTGNNLRFLGEMGFSNVSGVDFSTEAIHFCQLKGLGKVHHGDATHLPFSEQQFRLILATDILEHLENDLDGLKEMVRVLKPGGNLLLTVPAFPFLWGPQDIISHHKRRYHLKPLLHHLTEAGLCVEKRFYFNFLLFFPILFARRLIRWLKLPVLSENKVNTPLINQILKAVFLMDVSLAPFIKPPFGVSLFILAKKSTP